MQSLRVHQFPDHCRSLVLAQLMAGHVAFVNASSFVRAMANRFSLDDENLLESVIVKLEEINALIATGKTRQAVKEVLRPLISELNDELKKQGK